MTVAVVSTKKVAMDLEEISWYHGDITQCLKSGQRNVATFRPATSVPIAVGRGLAKSERQPLNAFLWLLGLSSYY